MTIPERVAEAKECRGDRGIALVALTVGPTQLPEECPPATEIAALLADRLDAAGREGLFAHFAACPLCYEQWLALATVAGAEERRGVLPGPWGRCWRPGAARYLMSGMVLALAASLAVFLLPVVRPPTVAGLITATYQDVATRRGVSGTEGGGQQLPLPWEGRPGAYGFAPEATTSPASWAFANGMSVGRALLLREMNFAGSNQSAAAEWATNPVAPYYWLGRWLVYLQYVCQTPDLQKAGPFWQEQGETLKRLQADFAARQEEEAATAAAGLQRLAAGLAELGRAPEDRRSLRRLQGTLTALARELAPAGTGG